MTGKYVYFNYGQKWECLNSSYANLVNIGDLVLYSLSGKRSYRKISVRFEAPRLDVGLIISCENFTGASAALLLRSLSNFRQVK